MRRKPSELFTAHGAQEQVLLGPARERTESLAIGITDGGVHPRRQTLVLKLGQEQTAGDLANVCVHGYRLVFVETEEADTICYFLSDAMQR